MARTKPMKLGEAAAAVEKLCSARSVSVADVSTDAFRKTMAGAAAALKGKNEDAASDLSRKVAGLSDGVGDIRSELFAIADLLRACA